MKLFMCHIATSGCHWHIFLATHCTREHNMMFLVCCVLSLFYHIFWVDLIILLFLMLLIYPISKCLFRRMLLAENHFLILQSNARLILLSLSLILKDIWERALSTMNFLLWGMFLHMRVQSSNLLSINEVNGCTFKSISTLWHET